MPIDMVLVIRSDADLYNLLLGHAGGTLSQGGTGPGVRSARLCTRVVAVPPPVLRPTLPPPLIAVVPN